jgi:hypothetical protein
MVILLCLWTPWGAGFLATTRKLGDDGYVLCVECFANYLDLIWITWRQS